MLFASYLLPTHDLFAGGLLCFALSRSSVVRLMSASFRRRPLIKLSISWRKNGALVSSGLSDSNRRLTVLSPVVSDAGYYECEAVLRSSSVPSVSAGAYLHVLGENQEIRTVRHVRV